MLDTCKWIVVVQDSEGGPVRTYYGEGSRDDVVGTLAEAGHTLETDGVVGYCKEYTNAALWSALMDMAE